MHRMFTIGLSAVFTSVQGFLKNERENALLAVIEHTRKNVRCSVFVLINCPYSC